MLPPFTAQRVITPTDDVTNRITAVKPGDLVQWVYGPATLTPKRECVFSSTLDDWIVLVPGELALVTAAYVHGFYGGWVIHWVTCNDGHESHALEVNITTTRWKMSNPRARRRMKQ